jgi:di/tricarboxylate transporter
MLSALPAGVTPEMLVVFAVVALALFLFVTEYLPIDVTAILVMVLLMVLEPFTRISPAEGISGFSNNATVTVLAMLILSAGITRTGAVQALGKRLSAFAGDNQFRQLLATVGVAGVPSGFINNTPVVAMLVPIISDVAHKGNTSPSKLLLPLSYASMLGGMLTLVGTSTNILASDVSARLLGEPFSMFEFTGLGVIVLVVGSAYLLTVGYRLTPERVPAKEDYIEEYEMEDYLSAVEVPTDSPVVGRTIADVVGEELYDADVLELVRDGEGFSDPLARKTLRPGDRLQIRTDRETLQRLMDGSGFSLVGGPRNEDELHPDDDEPNLLEVVVPARSVLVGETLRSSSFRQRYDATVLAFRSRGEFIHEQLENIRIRAGDTLLVQALPDSVERLSENPDFILAAEPDEPSYRTEKIPYAVAIILGVVGIVAVPWGTLGSALGVPALAALDFDIVVTALAGVVAMVVTGVLNANELYDSVDWDVIFLLAGVIPLGIALEQTGGAAFLGELVAASSAFLPAIGVLWVFYVATGLITSIISNNASVVLMIPVAVEAARGIAADPFAFVLAVTFAASTAFITPVGYQTNLFVYGPGGYKFSDYIRVGAPLQLLLSVVTVAGIAAIWGV